MKKLLFMMMVLSLFGLAGCTQKATWKWEENTKTFSDTGYSLQVVKTDKIAMSGGGDDIRIFYKLANRSSKSFNIEDKLIDVVTDKVSQNGKDLKEEFVVGNDDGYTADSKLAPGKTQLVSLTYAPNSYDGTVKINFGDNVASYSFKYSSLMEAE